jgi:hypothetical protein
MRLQTVYCKPQNPVITVSNKLHFIVRYMHVLSLVENISVTRRFRKYIKPEYLLTKSTSVD